MKTKTEITTPCSYQGAKQRIATKVVDVWWSDDLPERFYDLCCGGGSISIEMVKRGFPAADIRMADEGPWGRFWKEVGDGTFDLDLFSSVIAEMPKDRGKIQGWVKSLSEQHSSVNFSQNFLILQAASFGGKAIWEADGEWRNCSFRSFWQPTATSSRRTPVNPMMPMPETLLARVETVCSNMVGVRSVRRDVAGLVENVIPGSTVYVDPPYSETTKYGHTVDAIGLAGRIADRGCKVFVSEGRPLGAQSTLISEGRTKGGISGSKRRVHNQEWVTEFVADKDDGDDD